METFKRIVSFARPFGRKIPGYLLLSVLSVIFGVVNYALLGPLLTILFENQEAAVAVTRPEFTFSLDYFTEWFRWLLSTVIRNGGVIRGLSFVCGTLVVTCLFSNIFRYLSQRIVVSVETRLMQNIRGALFSKIVSLPVGWFTDRRKGDVLSSISNDVTEVQSSIAGSFHVFLREPLLVIGFLAMLIYMSPRLTLVSLVALPVSALVVTRITRKLRTGSVRTQQLMGHLVSRFEEAISGARIIKAFGARRYAEQSFDAVNTDHSQTLRQVRNRQEMASPLSEFLGITIAAGVLFYGGWLNYRGALGMNWQQFIVYIMFYWKVLEPAKTMAKQYALVQKGLVSAERIFRILDAPVEIGDGPRSVQEFREAVTFDHVSFSYGDEPVLRDVSLTIPKGKMIAVVGPSGAGKSTMADLLPRFYDVQDGAVRIDGTDIRELSLDSLVSLMGIVTQETILFNDTVFNNIAFGQEGVSREAVMEAARVACADEFIAALPQGYDTNIGDGGTKLSGGQRQRIAIARAVLKNPPILILDEATSALDTENERLVQQALAHLMGGRTSLVIAHRLSSIRHADEIFVVRDGRIVEHGSHEELIANNGLYSHLCKSQAFN